MSLDLAFDADEGRALGTGAAVGAVLGFLLGGRRQWIAGVGLGAAAGAVAGGLMSKQINAFLDAQTWLKSDVGQSVSGAVNAAIADLGPDGGS